MINNKNLIVILLFLLVKSYTFSQTVKVTSGSEIKNLYPTKTQCLIGEANGGIYSLRFQTDPQGLFYLDKHDNNLSLIFQKKIQLTIGYQFTYFRFHSVKLLNNTIYLFFSRYDRKLGGNILSVCLLDLDGNVKEVKHVSKIATTTELQRGTFNVFYSPDSTKICVQKCESLDRTKIPQWGFEVYDIAFTKLWEKSIDLPIQDKNYSLDKCFVDNKGNIHLLPNIIVRKTERIVRETYYQVFSYFYKEDLLKEYNVNLGEYIINDIVFKLDANDNIIAAGLYGSPSEDKNENVSRFLNVGKSKSLKGSFFILINTESKALALNATQEFSKDFLSQFKDETGKEKVLAFYTIRELFIKDSSIILVAENNSFETPSYNTNEAFKPIVDTKSYEQNFNDVIVTNIGIDGQADWIVRIPKRQTINSVKAMHLGVFPLMVKNKVCLLYNENPKNFTTEASAKTYVMGDETAAFVALVTINADGSFTKEKLFPTREKVTLIQPKFNIQLSPTSALMYGDGYVYYRLVKLDF